ncbi:MAG: hypothetical protein O3A66_02295 [Proteobacteria bacterium]|nr:hypothetical protein [Pseudomonadota bacterium]
MSFFTILSSVVGGTSALVQNIIEKKQEAKAQEVKYDRLLQIEELRLQTARINMKACHEKSFSAFAKAVVQTSKPLAGKHKSERVANFIIALTRPAITFLLIALVAAVCVKAKTHEFFILETAFATLDYTLSYWFVRRSFEKRGY